MDGAIYHQSPPLVQASRQPLEWQSFDVIWKVPRFDEDGKLLKPAIMTVLQNGVLIQDHYELPGLTLWGKAPYYEPRPPEGPITLQYHGRPGLRFRNIWIRETPERVTPEPVK